MTSLQDVIEAKERIAPYIAKTPLLRVPALDKYLGCQVYLKPENLQYTGSFKLRGAANKLLSLSEAEKSAGVVAASSGNHAQGVAYSAQLLGIDATIIMPLNANPVKIQSVEEYGAELILHGETSSQRTEKAKELADKSGKVEVHPFSDDYIRAGQGTIALEILEDEPEINQIVVPIGGGGLISGIAIATKESRPEINILGVEPEGASRYSESLDAGQPVKLSRVNTIADGTRTDQADADNFQLIKQYVDDIIAVSDEAIKEAMKLILAKAKLVVEPSSAMVFAAALANKINVNPTDKVCFVVSGGNNDLSLLGEILNR